MCRRASIRYRARLLTIGEDGQKLGQPHVGAMLGDEPLDGIAPAPAAGVAQDLDRWLADVA
jgi:hypothetical protein